MKKITRIYPLFLLLLLAGCDTQQGQNAEDTDSIITEEEASEPVPEVEEPISARPHDPKASTGLSTYHNDRFNFCISYPQGLFSLDKASQNNDGKSFVNMDGIQMEVYGRNQLTTDETLDDAYKFDTTQSKDDNARKITYATKGNNWFVVSGKSGDYIFYRKTYLLNDHFATVEFTYPAGEKTNFEPMMKQILNNFPGCEKTRS